MPTTIRWIGSIVELLGATPAAEITSQNLLSVEPQELPTKWWGDPSRCKIVAYICVNTEQAHAFLSHFGSLEGPANSTNRFGENGR